MKKIDVPTLQTVMRDLASKSKPVRTYIALAKSLLKLEKAAVAQDVTEAFRKRKEFKLLHPMLELLQKTLPGHHFMIGKIVSANDDPDFKEDAQVTFHIYLSVSANLSKDDKSEIEDIVEEIGKGYFDVLKITSRDIILGA